MKDVETLRASLETINAPLGYLFNADREQVVALLKGLLTTRERYGYTSCPCRLASGDRDMDRDIICPCVYRKPDVEEFGSCYCGLYVSDRWKGGIILHRHVPERRPPAGKRAHVSRTLDS